MSDNEEQERPKSFLELLTIKKAANKYSLPYRQLLQAVNDGLIPYYRLGKSRRYVVASEVICLMRKGDGND